MDTNIHTKINILQIHSSLSYAGGQRNMIAFARMINSDFFNSYVASYNKGGEYEKDLKKEGIPYIAGDSNSKTILQVIARWNIDVVHIHRSGHTNQIETEIIKGAKEINPNIIIIEKNVFGKYDPVCDRDIDCSFFQSMMHLNERYLVTSKKIFNFEKHKVLYNMIVANEFERYRLSAEKIAEFKKAIGIQPNNFVIGKIARVDITKWSDLILQMMPYLVRVIPNVTFLIIGVPESRKKVILKSNYKKNIIIIEPTSDQQYIHSFYQSLDVLAHSSKIGECNGNTINEAMFWEKPVVVNSTPHRDNGQLEQVLHMENGIIANYPQTYARAIAYLLKDHKIRKKMGENGRARVLEINNPREVIRQVELYILNKRGVLSEKVSYSPSEEEILQYKKEYKKRLSWEFGRLSIGEKLSNIFKGPKKFYWKIRDFLEDKQMVRINYGK